jgi:O-Antigen ligase
MTNDPASIAALLRSLVVYVVCAILAIIIGVLMTNPLTYSAMGFVGVLCAILFLPIFLKWHHILMIACWSTPISVFFLKGSPALGLVMIAISFGISVVERALNPNRQFLKVPQVTWPLICLIGVVLITAKLTGGIGLKAFGSDVYGGKKYVFLVVGILGYFALTAHPIPPQRARLYVILYFFGGMLGTVEDLYPYTPGFLHFIFWFIPPQFLYYDPSAGEQTRLAGTGWAATAFLNAMMAYYGLRGIFLSGKPWRMVVFFIGLMLIFLGGFRSALLLTMSIMTLQFFLEGLHRTNLLIVALIFSLACAGATIPLASHLPFTFQRTLAFLPRSWVHLSSSARSDAEGSWDWRVQMWQALLPQVPKHLLLGKGYAITMEDWSAITEGSSLQNVDASQNSLALSGDYHNGPLSVVLPFGIWGVIAVVWFLVASIWVVYRNYRYCPPEFKVLNTFLFTIYVISVIDFLFLFGGLSAGMSNWAGILGMSVCINRGVCKVPPRPAPVNIPFARARGLIQPAFRPAAPRARII